MSITELSRNSPCYGITRYFLSDRCRNTDGLRQFNRRKIRAEELVTFDCSLMEMEEVEETWGNQSDVSPDGYTPDMHLDKKHQVLAVIIRPGIRPDYYLESDPRFEFCGYDLVEDTTYTSAVTNCGARFEKAIRYEQLNRFGLVGTYREAVAMQLDLDGKYPEESHADCEIVELWRRLT